MSSPKVLNGMCVVLGALAVTVMHPRVTLAGTTTLICHVIGTMLVEDGSTTIELNEAQSSVVVHFAASHCTAACGPPRPGEPASSLGPLPAKFGANTISFSNPNGPVTYVIDRLTGVFVANYINVSWTCDVGKKKF